VCKEKTVMSFSMQNQTADVFAETFREGVYRLHTPVGMSEIKLVSPGSHNVMNALAAVAACLQVDIDLEDIVTGLSGFSGVPGRLSVSYLSSGACLIDDTYNANPQSLTAAIEVVVEMGGVPWLVLGDMSELGDDTASLHFDIGNRAKKAGIKRLFAMGKYSREAVEAFGDGARFFDDRDELINVIKSEMNSDTVILVKGSRIMEMERVVNTLLNDNKKIRQEVI
jgi:UDP-N-acetylmuramoyl-tripeptide--D-alanyl-D-alanine ligase